MSGEIATAYVQILPSFEGITAKLKAGLGDTDAVGREVGVKIGSQITAGLESSAAKAQASVNKLTAAVTAASDKQATAAGRVRVAETALAEVRDREGAKESQIVAAEERLATAQRAAAEAAARTSAATEQLSAAQETAARTANQLTEGAERAAHGLRGVGAAGEEAGAEAREGMAEASEGLAAFGEHLAELAKTFAEFFVVEKLVEFSKESVEAGEAVERTSSLIEAQIKATGDAAHVTAEQVQELATGISDSSGVARSEILLAEQAILRFGNVANQAGKGNDIFTRASKDAADLAAVMHTSVPAAAALLGKALNNPTVGLTRLTRAGVSFTAQQTAQIKALTNSGHLLQAQGIILNHFEGQFAGAAAASATPLDRLKSSIDNLQASLGQALLPILDAGITKLADLATAASDAAQGGLSKVSEAFDALEEHKDLDLAKVLGVDGFSPIIADLDGLRDKISETARDFSSDFAAAKPGLEAFGKAVAEAGAAAGGALLEGVDAAAKALHPFAVALSAIFTSVASHGHFLDSFAVGIAAGAVAFKLVSSAISGYVRITGTAIEAAKALKVAMAEADLAELANPIGLAVAAVVALGVGVYALTQHFHAAKPAIDSYAEALEASNGKINAAIRAQAAQTLQQNGALDAAQKLGIGLSEVTDASLGNAKAFADIKAKGQGLVGTYNAIVSSNDRLVASGKLTVSQARDRVAGAQSQIDAYNKLVTVLDANKGMLATNEAAYKQVTEAEEKSTGATVLDSAQKKAAQAAAKQLTTDQKSLNAAIKEQNSDLTELENALDALVSGYFGVSAASDQFHSDLNALVTAAKASKTGLKGNSDAAIAYRSSIEQAVGGVSNFVEAEVKQGVSSKKILSDYRDRREALVTELRQLGLNKQQIAFYTGALNKIPGLVKTDYTTPGATTAAAAAKRQHDLVTAIPGTATTKVSVLGSAIAAANLHVVQQRAQNIPPHVNTAVYAQGTKNAEEQIDAVVRAEAALHDKTVTINYRTLYTSQGKKNQGDPGTDAAAIAGGGVSYGAIQKAQAELAGRIKAFGATLGPSLLKGLTGPTDAINGIIAATTKSLNALMAAKGLPANSKLTAFLKADTKKLDGLAAQRDAIAARLATAQTNLQGAKDQKASDLANFQSGIISGDSLISSSDDAPKSVLDFTTKLQAEATAAANFKTQLAALEKDGISKTLLGQLAAAGPTQGGAEAAYLSSATPAQIKAINAAQSALETSATQTATAAATYLDQAAITRNQQTVDVLARQEKTAETRMAEVAEALQKAYAAELRKVARQAAVIKLGKPHFGDPVVNPTPPPKKKKGEAADVVINITTPEVRSTAAVLTKLNKTHSIFGNVRAVRV